MCWRMEETWMSTDGLDSQRQGVCGVYSVTCAVVCLTDLLPDESICCEFPLPQQSCSAATLPSIIVMSFHRQFLLGKRERNNYEDRTGSEGFELRVPSCRANWIPCSFAFSRRRPATPEKRTWSLLCLPVLLLPPLPLLTSIH